MHFCHSGSDVKVVCHTASEAKDTLKSNLGIQSIRTETLIGMAFQFCSKCGLDLICKNHISCFISVQTVLNQSGSAEEKKNRLGWQSEQEQHIPENGINLYDNNQLDRGLSLNWGFTSVTLCSQAHKDNVL